MELQSYIRRPQALTSDTVDELKELVERYPYYEAARMLLLKNLYSLHDEGFEEELSSSALCLGNLKSLFYLLEGETFQIDTAERKIKDEIAVEESDRTMSLIDKFLQQLPEEKRPAVSTAAPNPAVDYVSYLMQEEKQEPEKVEEAVSATAGIAQDREEAADESSRPVQEISAGDKEASRKPEENATEAEAPAADCVTETMARILIKQKSYSKALEIIRQLNLKYPEKNAYFADQIRFLEKLIIITNKQR